MNKHRWSAVVVPLLLLMLLLTSCGSKSQPQGGAAPSTPPGGTKPSELVVALSAEPVILDPTLAGDVPSHNLNRNIFDTLLYRDEKLELKGGLAESWNWENPTTLVFKLRKGVKFHNGEPFTAEAVKFTYDSVLDVAHKSRARASVELVDHVEVVDESTVKLITKQPFPVLVARNQFAGTGSVAIVPPKLIKEQGWEAFAKRPVGTGAFKFVEWVKGDHITLEANPEYWRGKVGVPKVSFKIIPEAATRVAALLSGQVHIAENIPPDQVGKMQQNKDVRISATTNGMINPYYQFNTRVDSPVKDVRVRQAINYAIDMDGIVKALTAGMAERRAVPLDPNDFGYDASVKPYPYDPAKAKELLKDAGYPDGFAFTMYTSNGRYMADQAVSEAIASDLAKVGIKVKVQPAEWGVYLDMLAKKTAGPMYIIGWGSGLFDADVLNDEFNSKGTYASSNLPEVDDLLAKSRVEPNPDTRKQLFAQAQKMLHDQAAYVPAFQPKAVFGVNNKVNWEASIGELIFLWNAAFK